MEGVLPVDVVYLEAFKALPQCRGLPVERCQAGAVHLPCSVHLQSATNQSEIIGLADRNSRLRDVKTMAQAIPTPNPTMSHLRCTQLVKVRAKTHLHDNQFGVSFYPDALHSTGKRCL